VFLLQGSDLPQDVTFMGTRSSLKQANN